MTKSSNVIKALNKLKKLNELHVLRQNFLKELSLEENLNKNNFIIKTIPQ